MYQWFGVYENGVNDDKVVKMEFLFFDRYLEALGIDIIGLDYI